MMANTYRISFLILLAQFVAINVFATYGYLGFGAGQFGIREGNSVRPVNGLSENIIRAQGNYIGGDFRWSISRKTVFSFGIAVSKINFQKETQGIFPETSEYGLATVHEQNSYWTFPLAITHSFYRSHSRSLSNGIRIAYIPCIKGSGKMTFEMYGGAIGSSFASNYPNNDQTFEQSMIISFTNIILSGNHWIMLRIDPYAGIGSSYFISDHISLNTFSFGVDAALYFSLPKISISREHCTDSNAVEKQRLLKQKQKEIDDQLKKQPK